MRTMLRILFHFLWITTAAWAHDIWIDANATVHYGHDRTGEQHGAQRIIGEDEVARRLCKQGERVGNEASPKCDALLVTLEGVYYAKTPYGTQKVPKNEAKMVLKSWQSFESVKRINNDAGIAPLGAGLELSLTAAPSTLHVGDKLRLLVTVDGLPKADVAVAYGDRVIGASDAQGHINVKIREAGLQHVRASYSEKGDGVLCDEIVHATALNLEIAE